MFIDYSLLQVRSSLTNSDKKTDICVNVVGDWAPVSGGTSDIVTRRQRDYYGIVGDFFSDGDLNIVNVETALDDAPLPLHKLPPRFVDSEELAGSLRSINTHLACLANNHIFDNGPSGLKKTRDRLAGAAIACIGAGFGREQIYTPFCFEKSGTKLAVLNIADGVEANEKYNDGIGAADLESYRVVDQIRTLKNDGYVVILIIHAGIVFLPAPPPFLQQLYREFIDIGADIIIGHHPHVVQGCEIYNGKPIFYSIGHFGIHRKAGRLQERQGLLLHLKLFEGTISKINIVPFVIEREYIRSLTQNEQVVFKEEFSQMGLWLHDAVALERMWNLYVFSRPPVINFRRIVREYKYDFNKSRAFSKGQAVSFVNRFLLAYYSDNDPDDFGSSFLTILRKYGVIKKYYFFDKFFLFQRDVFFVFRCIKNRIVSFIKNIKRSIDE